jgi:hypothetical protein
VPVIRPEALSPAFGVSRSFVATAPSVADGPDAVIRSAATVMSVGEPPETPDSCNSGALPVASCAFVS